jgi:hypothetical protein
MGADLFGSYVAFWQLWFLEIMLSKTWKFKMLWRNRTYFTTNGNCRFWNIIFIIGTMLVKITDDNAKEAQVQKH